MLKQPTANNNERPKQQLKSEQIQPLKASTPAHFAPAGSTTKPNLNSIYNTGAATITPKRRLNWAFYFVKQATLYKLKKTEK